MKKLLMGAAVVAVLATPAFAQSYDPNLGSGNIVAAPWAGMQGPIGGSATGFSAYAYAPVHHGHVRNARGLRAQAYAPMMGNSDSVYAFGHYQGTDPDPNVRLELRRDDISGY